MARQRVEMPRGVQATYSPLVENAGAVRGTPARGSLTAAAVCWALPWVAAAGDNVLPISTPLGVFFGYRIAVVALTAFVFVYLLRSASYSLTTRVARLYLWLGCVWVVWGLSLTLHLVGPQLKLAIQELLQVALGFVAGFALLALDVPRRPRAIEWLRRGWVTAYIMTGTVGIWEFATGRHLLHTAAVASSDTLSGASIFSTFSNPNDYAAFAVLAAPFLAWSAGRSRGILRVFYVVLIFTVPLVVLGEKSTIASFGLLMEIVVGAGILVRRRGVLLLLLFAVAVGFFALRGVFVPGFSRASGQLQQRTSGNFGNISSETDRIHLVLDGLWFARQSFGVGAGPDTFPSLIDSGSAPYATNGIASPHFYWIEVLTEYGVVVLAMLILLFATIFRKARGRSWPMVVVRSGIAGFVVASCASSGYIGGSIQWVFLASLVVLVAARELDSNRNAGSGRGDDLRSH